MTAPLKTLALRDAAQAVVDSVWTTHDDFDTLDAKITTLAIESALTVDQTALVPMQRAAQRVVEERETGEDWHELKETVLLLANEVAKFDKKVEAAKELGLM